MATIADSAMPATAGTKAPIVIDLGKQGRKAVRELRKGQGELMADVSRCIEELQATGAVAAGAQPVVVIVRQRPRRPAWPLG